jgi:hypothetical protein
LFFFLAAAMALSIPGAPLANQQFMGRAHLNPAVCAGPYRSPLLFSLCFLLGNVQKLLEMAHCDAEGEMQIGLQKNREFFLSRFR